MKQKDKQPRTEEHQEDEKKSERHVPSVVQAVLRWICAGLVIPALFFLPKFIGTITAALDGRMWILSIPWTFYTVMELYIFFIRHRKTQTLDSFATENMIHLILSLGAFHFLSLAERIDIRYRRNAIYVWVTYETFFVIFLFSKIHFFSVLYFYLSTLFFSEFIFSFLSTFININYIFYLSPYLSPLFDVVVPSSKRHASPFPPRPCPSASRCPSASSSCSSTTPTTQRRNGRRRGRRRGKKKRESKDLLRRKKRRRRKGKSCRFTKRILL